MVRCIRVPKEDGNSVRMRLKRENVLNRDVRIQAKDDFLMIPILAESFGDYPVEDVDLEVIERKETDYRAFLPERLRTILPNSYDNIGDITIIKLVDELLPFKNEIGEALMRVSVNTRAVLLDSGVKGEMRIRDLELIAGEGPTETMHRESGVTMLTDPAKVYFNPRLATERERVASLVKDDEVIIDMFAGVAPFPLVICRYANPKAVYAIDLNHEAVEYMKRNIAMNHVKNIVPIEGDARDEIRKLPDADRVIMNLPHMAEQYLPDALGRTRKGGMVHMHRIMERETSDDECDSMILDMRSRGLECILSEKRELKTYSPSASVYVLDIIRG
ncbi:MAG: class I SAM-dependent methyltransferase family protein [Candidatus Methanomethylophilaceae archaeon]